MVAKREPYEVPAIRAFAAELTAWRGTMSKVELAERLGYTPQLIGQLEAGKNIPSEQFSEDADTFFKTNGLFLRLWKLIMETRRLAVLPPGFSKYVQFEGQAGTIRAYSLVVIQGLLQTPEYARAILLALQPPDTVDQFVTARMERQAILTREKPPRLWVTLDERALRCLIGGREVMRGQLQHLLEVSKRPNIMIDVVPQSAESHVGLEGSLVLLGFANEPDIAYTESSGRGQVVEDAAGVSDFHVRYDLIRGHALPVAESRKLIESILEGL
ncbi:helix-turn-helix domain-containing protein [Actinoallomurus iriomotensis]|uniref:Transcriptional regulator n=1 Tax=Actinoallomurus iriomotensis TaxID=478107 RepID=A0A9W6SAA9_9ACTN|nr:helix-turn-helix transcriptional regulator [Actinoallomurus iriomotensis]GLY89953.1 transcriptional regulator [Actinoallomurus iriomotensis]